MSVLRRSSRTDSGPSGSHRFVEPEDVRSYLALSATQQGSQMTVPFAMAGASVRPAHCALAGCGKSREDAIHRPKG